MAGKTSTIVGLLLALAILVAVSEGTRKKGKFSTPGGSHCRWVEKKKHNGTDVSYSLRCKCHSKAGGMMKYRCTYHTSFHGAEGKSSQFTETFFENIKGNQHGCNMNSITVGDGEATMATTGETTATDCK